MPHRWSAGDEAPASVGSRPEAVSRRSTKSSLRPCPRLQPLVPATEAAAAHPLARAELLDRQSGRAEALEQLTPGLLVQVPLRIDGTFDDSIDRIRHLSIAEEGTVCRRLGARNIAVGSRLALRRLLGEVFRKLAAQMWSRVEERRLVPDHVHLALSIPPKCAASQTVGFFKARARALFTCCQPPQSRGDRMSLALARWKPAHRRGRTHNMHAGLLACPQPIVRPLVAGAFVQDQPARRRGSEHSAKRRRRSLGGDRAPRPALPAAIARPAATSAASARSSSPQAAFDSARVVRHAGTPSHSAPAACPARAAATPRSSSPIQSVAVPCPRESDVAITSVVPSRETPP